MSGRKHRVKGSRVEREVVALAHGLGLEAKRVPLSGAAEGFKGDVLIGDFQCEVKARAGGSGFKTLERWLAANDILFLKRDRQLPLVVLSWASFARIMRREPVT